jgi:hypothetical protein
MVYCRIRESRRIELKFNSVMLITMTRAKPLHCKTLYSNSGSNRTHGPTGQLMFIEYFNRSY